MKTKYTKKQRHEIYKEALDYVNNPKNKEKWGLCQLFKDICGVTQRCTREHLSRIVSQYLYEYEYAILPEIWCFIYDCYPELNWDERKVILEFCIEMTKPLK